jgi:hypothetical protein
MVAALGKAVLESPHCACTVRTIRSSALTTAEPVRCVECGKPLSTTYNLAGVRELREQRTFDVLKKTPSTPPWAKQRRLRGAGRRPGR